MGELRVNQAYLQALNQPVTTSFNTNYTRLEYSYLPLSPPNFNTNYTRLEYAYYQSQLPQLVSPFIYLQYIVVAPEWAMSNDLFPASANVTPLGSQPNAGHSMMRGTTFSTHARPIFSNKVAEHSGGGETRTAYWAYPKWEFELEFEWLPNTSQSNNTDFKTLCGFFLARGGTFDTFLFRAPDDHYAENILLYTGDGVISEFELYRPMGSYNEPIGQWDPLNTKIWFDGPVTLNVPALSPFTITLHAGFDTLNSITGKTDVSPAAPVNSGQYSRVGNVLTFHSTSANEAVVIDYKRLLTYGVADDYSVVSPRTLVFLTAPPLGTDIIATFEYYFVVRFADDSLGFEQWAHRLWSLGEMKLRSVLI